MFLRKLLTGFRRFSRKHGDISNGALEKSKGAPEESKGALEKPKGALEKSVCTNILPTNFHAALSIPFQKYNRSPTVIVTLDPNKLAEKKQQCVLIGGQKSFTIRPLLLGQSSHVENMRIHYERTEMVNRPFPDAKAAFLYYSMSPERPRIGGELRIRLTSSGDPASFESGSDLLRSDGLPWSRPLYVLPRYFLPLYEKLREERFVPDDLDRVLLTSPSARLNYNRSHILYTLNDTFIVDFSSHMSSLFVITERGVESVSNRNLFFDQRGMVMRRPYTGAYKSPSLDAPISTILMNL